MYSNTNYIIIIINLEINFCTVWVKCLLYFDYFSIDAFLDKISLEQKILVNGFSVLPSSKMKNLVSVSL